MLLFIEHEGFIYESGWVTFFFKFEQLTMCGVIFIFGAIVFKAAVLAFEYVFDPAWVIAAFVV